MAGEATLKITLGEGIQYSNYNDNSFVVENVGDKAISRIEIDVTNALFPDTVFDPYGVAGDTVAKQLTINYVGSTGVIAPDASSYIGAGGTAGYEGVQLVFDPAVNGGFNPGEQVRFSVDMDPNSIAGSTKRTVDAGSDPTWDVGGVSGAELIGSTFTVTFADGTTASGQLQGAMNPDGTPDQAGAQALASQAGAGGTVDLQVNGLAPGGTGSYAAGGPQVIVDGPAGETARIVLGKGFIQPDPDGSYTPGLDGQLDALAASDFPANNAVEFQVVDVFLTGSPQDVTSLFDFTGVPVAGVADAGALPLGFLASLVDPARGGLATGPVTTPIYLVADAGANAAPLADDDAASSDGSAVTVDVLANDSDADGDPVSLASFGQGADGTVARDDNGTPGDLTDDRLVYTPGAGFSGSDSFTYTVEDGQGGSDTATVTVFEGAPPPAFALHINVGGDAYVSTDGVTYVADTYFSGGSAYTIAAPISLTDDPPLFQDHRAGSFSYAIPVENGTYVVDLGFIETYWTQSGKRVFDVTAEGIVVVDNLDVFAAAGGKDTAYTTQPITVEVTDGVLNLAFSGEVRKPLLSAIDIRSVSSDASPPVAAADAYAVDEDATLTVNAANGVLANDSDPDGGALAASLVSGPANGTLTLNADGSFGYTPEADFNGTDSFTYAVTDPSGFASEATVTITVAPVADAPVAEDDAAGTTGSAVTIDVLANDGDADGDPVSLASFGQGADGTVARDDNGTPGDLTDDRLVYTPGAGFSGSDSFTYTVEDGQGGSDTATVTVFEGAPPPAFALHINVGGDAYVSTDGVTYVADTYFSGGSAYTIAAPISLTDDPPLFQDHRAGSFSYAIPVENGTYVVDLGFIETYWTQSGKRVFDVTAEGIVVVDNLDVFAAAGGKDTAYTTQPITVEVTDGVLNLAFSGEVRKPLLSAIDIRSVSSDASPPVAAADAYAVDEDATLTVNAANGVLANDSDPDGGALAASLVSGPANGTLTLNADGSFGYTPEADFNGTDSFTYAVTDPSGFASEATVTITVAPVADAPVAEDDAAGTTGSAVTIDVLANDGDADGDPVSLASFGQGADGTVARDDNGTPGDLTDDRLVYTPGAGFSGSDSFTYTVEDGQGGSDTATVTVSEGAPPPAFALHINAGGDAYTAADGTEYVADTYFVGGSSASTSLAIAGTADDALYQAHRTDGAFSYAIPVENGTYVVDLGFIETYWTQSGKRVFDVTAEGIVVVDNLDVFAAAGGKDVAYTAQPITVEVTDGVLNLAFSREVRNPLVSAISIVSGTPPTAADDAYAVDEDTQLTVNAANGVLANDSDPDGGALAASLVSGPANGTLTLNADGSFSYLPALNFNGSDSFTYAVTDATGFTSEATATIAVGAVNDAPVAVDDNYLTPVNQALTIGVAEGLLKNDADADGDPLAVIAVNGSAVDVGRQVALDSGALLTLRADGRFDYAPAPDYVGEDSFTYTVDDPSGVESTATVVLTVTSDLPPSSGVNAGAAVDEGGTVTIGAAALSTNDPDTPTNQLVYTLLSVPANGGLTRDGIALATGDSFTQADIGLGLLAYAHDGSETLSDGFDYEVSDGTYALDGQSFAISVASVNDDPVAGADSYNANYETLLSIPAQGVLENDTDAENGSLAVTAVNGAAAAVGSEIVLPSGALLTLRPDGSFDYTPAAGFSDEDSFSYTVGDGQGGSATGSVTVNVSPPAPEFTLYINSGGPGYTSANGTVFVADTGFVGGKAFKTTSPIAETVDDALFQSERYGTFSYQIPVDVGRYAVSFDFAEIFFGQPGQRVFDVKIEGKTIFNDLDVVVKAGGKDIAWEPPATVVDVTDGILDIGFISEIENAKVNSVSIVKLSAPDGFPPVLEEDSASTPLGTSVDIDVLANDLDLDGDTLAIVAAGDGATLGTVVINDAGTPGDLTDDYLTYTSNGSGAGTDFFTYTVEDSAGKTSTATVSVDVDPLDAIAFSSVSLTGIPNKNYTSLQFGADGRLYASHRFGEIYAFEIEQQTDATGKITGYVATDVETISIIKTIPNYNDDGTPAPSVTSRQVTGIVVAGTAENPVLYVSSSDPREGGGQAGGAGDTGLDTNSGIISRLTWNGSAWEKLDLVRGLPRSEENHSTNGMVLTTDPQTGDRILLAAQGGNTNAGAPSKNFAYASETALSAAILKIDLTMLESGTGQFAVKTDGASQYVYDLPTVLGDTVGVFGGMDGLNQARLVEGGPVSVYASGLRNSYDLVETADGDLYTIDNGANFGWGGSPKGEGTQSVTDQPATIDPDGFNSVNNLDHLEWIPGPGYYAGHPNPIRANPGGAGITYTDANGVEVWSQNPGGAWPPIDPSFSFPEDGDFRMPGVEDDALATWTNSTNGIAEYTSSAFQGAMQGNLITASFDSSVYRIVVNPGNTGATKEAIATGLNGIPLDVIAQGDNDRFPGTIWVAYVAGGTDIGVLVPTFVTGTPDDLDGDGFLNDDEIANGTNPNSPASVPPDNDGDFVSDLTDEDDDNDGLFDPVDHFALDATNGTSLVVNDDEPFLNPLRNDNPGTGFAGLGFTGWMTNDTADYLTLYDDDNLIAGGTSGIFSIVETSSGDARGSLNTQENGFQFGVTIGTTGPMLVQAGLINVFSPLTLAELAEGQSEGIQIGTGDQDNYVKLAIGVDAGGNLGIVLLHEENGIVLEETFMPASSVPIGSQVDLFLELDRTTGTVRPGWQVDGGPGQIGDAITVDGDILAALQGTYQNGGEDSGLAVGVIATSGATGGDFAAQYDFIDLFAGTLADQFDLIA